MSEEMDKAIADLRSAIGAIPLRPERGEFPITAGVGVVGAIVGVTGGLGVWAIPYAVIVLVLWLLLRAVLIVFMRG